MARGIRRICITREEVIKIKENSNCKWSFPVLKELGSLFRDLLFCFLVQNAKFLSVKKQQQISEARISYCGGVLKLDPSAEKVKRNGKLI